MLSSSSVFARPATKPSVSTKTYTQRAELSDNELTQRIFTLMDTKKTNLTLSADVHSAAELLTLADNIGDEISVLKIHYDIVKDFSLETVDELKLIAKNRNFIIMEDRKFAEIGKIEEEQYAGGKYQIADWATLVTAHAVSGPDGIKALQTIGSKKGNGVLLVAQMSSKDNLIDANYTRKVVEMAENLKDFVVGFVAQETISVNESLINFTPGIQFGVTGDAKGQTYHTPEKAFAAGTDNIIVGSGIYQAKNANGIVTAESQLAAAKLYRAAAWAAYLTRVEVRQENILGM